MPFLSAIDQVFFYPAWLYDFTYRIQGPICVSPKTLLPVICPEARAKTTFCVPEPLVNAHVNIDEILLFDGHNIGGRF
jgi:hypothetical protein